VWKFANEKYPTSSTVEAAPATFGNVVVSTTGPIVWKLSAEGSTMWAFHGGGDRRGTYLSTGDTLSGVAVGNSGTIVVAGSLFAYKSDG
jgi:hypothetical protein